LKSGTSLVGGIFHRHERTGSSRCRPPCAPKTKDANSGLTLLELLVVMAIISLLATLMTPAFLSIGKGNELAVSGGRIVDLLNLARVNSMSRNVMTAVVLNTDPSSDGAYRSIALMERPAPNAGTTSTSADWKQTSKWEELRQGIVVVSSIENGTDIQPLKSPDATTPTPSLPSLNYRSKPVATSYSVFFLPNGSLFSGKTTKIRLAKSEGSPANYFDVTILPTSGRTKIDRP